jgi:hypothetical protein
MLALLSILVLQADPALQRALDAALANAETKATLVEWKAPTCRGRYEVLAPIEASGRVAVRIRGATCDQWGWATVLVTGLGAIATRDVRLGEALTGAYEFAEVEVRRGGAPVRSIDPSATSLRALRKGQAVSSESFRVGPPPGAEVTVRATAGAIVVEQKATITPCTGGRVCASLPNGRRVTGVMHEGVLELTHDDLGGRL